MTKTDVDRGLRNSGPQLQCRRHNHAPPAFCVPPLPLPLCRTLIEVILVLIDEREVVLLLDGGARSLRERDELRAGLAGLRRCGRRDRPGRLGRLQCHNGLVLGVEGARLARCSDALLQRHREGRHRDDQQRDQNGGQHAGHSGATRHDCG